MPFPAAVADRRTIGRLLFEITVVVVGILIAFGLDAAWDGRTRATQEQAHLRALASDFEQNAARLREHIATEERISGASRALLDIARRASPGAGDSSTRLLGMVFNSGRFEPVMGAYEALVNSAGLTLIGDDSLRAALADFSAQVSGRYTEHFSNEVYLSFIRQFAGEMRFFANEVTGNRPADGYASALRDPAFQEYLALRYLSERDVARQYRQLLAQAELVLGRLRDQVE